MSRMPSRRRLRSGALMTALVLLLTGCLSQSEDEGQQEVAADPEAIADAAESEGTLTWYTSIPEAVSAAAVEGFEAEYDITVEMIVLTSGLMTTRYASEMDAGNSPADVVTVADPVFFGDAVSKDWMETLDVEDVPALADWPEEALREDAYALVNIQPIGVTIDTNKADPEDFQTWEQLLDPSLKGQLYLVNPANVPNWLAHMQMMSDTYGEDFLSSLAAQEPTLVDSSVPGAQQLAAGAGTVVYPSLLSVSNPLKAQGASVETVFPTPTTGVEQYAGISTRAPHPNAARLFMDYLLGEEAQQTINQNIGSSVLGDLVGTVPLPEGYESPNVAGAVSKKADILAALGLG
jgi:iron(III) transport system substrate-binding protein